MCNAKIREVLSYIIDMVLYALFSSVFNGARVSAIELILFMIMIYITLNMKPGGRQKIYTFIRKMVPVRAVSCRLTSALSSPLWSETVFWTSFSEKSAMP